MPTILSFSYNYFLPFQTHILSSKRDGFYYMVKSMTDKKA